MMCSHTHLEILSSPRASQTERTSRSPPAESRLCRVATGEYKHSKPTCKYVHTGVPVTTPGTGSNHPKNSEPSVPWKALTLSIRYWKKKKKRESIVPKQQCLSTTFLAYRSILRSLTRWSSTSSKRAPAFSSSLIWHMIVSYFVKCGRHTLISKTIRPAACIHVPFRLWVIYQCKALP